MGVLTGYLGAAPSVVWALGAMAIVLAPVLVPVAVWIYTLVFAFSALWYAHYTLAALAGDCVPNATTFEILPPVARCHQRTNRELIEEARLIERPAVTGDTPPSPWSRP